MGLVRLDESLLTSIDESSAPPVLLYPSPAYRQLAIAAEGMREVAVFDTDGRVMPVRFEATGPGLYTADVSALAPALYVVRVRFRDGSIAIRKLVKK
jgi:hypothetical protein